MNLPLHRLIRHNGHKKSKGRTKGQVKEKRKGEEKRRMCVSYMPKKSEKKGREINRYI